MRISDPVKSVPSRRTKYDHLIEQVEGLKLDEYLSVPIPDGVDPQSYRRNLKSACHRNGLPVTAVIEAGEEAVALQRKIG